MSPLGMAITNSPSNENSNVGEGVGGDVGRTVGFWKLSRKQVLATI